MIAPNKSVIRIYELVKAAEAGKMNKESAAEEVSRLSDELNKAGISDDYIERMIATLQVSERVNDRLRGYPLSPD